MLRWSSISCLTAMAFLRCLHSSVPRGNAVTASIWINAAAGLVRKPCNVCEFGALGPTLRPADVSRLQVHAIFTL